MTDDPLLLDYKDGIAKVSINRPEAANAVNAAFAERLADISKMLKSESGLRCVLICAKGPVFCAGGDLNEFASKGDDLPVALGAMIDDVHGALRDLRAMNAPIVAAVGGSVGGMGLSFIAISDVVIADTNAKFVFGYTAAGLTPDGGTTWLIPKLIGRRRAAELMLTNRSLSADLALEWGLINQLVPPTKLEEEANLLAKRLADGPTGAFAQVRRLLDQSETVGFSAHLDAEKASMLASAASPDGREGITAFAEKRRPTFRG